MSTKPQSDPIAVCRELIGRFSPGSFSEMQQALLPAVLIAEAINRNAEATDRLVEATDKNTAAIFAARRESK